MTATDPTKRQDALTVQGEDYTPLIPDVPQDDRRVELRDLLRSVEVERGKGKEDREE